MLRKQRPRGATDVAASSGSSPDFSFGRSQSDHMLFSRKATELPGPQEALKGRSDALPTAEEHFVLGRPLKGPYPHGLETALFGLGCFWGAERKFWQLGEGIWVTAVGYAGGFTPNPTYEEVCSGRTGHNE